MRNVTEQDAPDRLLGELLLQQMAVKAVLPDYSDVPASPFSLALIQDVFAVLERHGYGHGNADHVARAARLVRELGEAYEGVAR